MGLGWGRFGGPWKAVPSSNVPQEQWILDSDDPRLTTSQLLTRRSHGKHGASDESLGRALEENTRLRRELEKLEKRSGSAESGPATTRSRLICHGVHHGARERRLFTATSGAACCRHVPRVIS